MTQGDDAPDPARQRTGSPPQDSPELCESCGSLGWLIHHNDTHGLRVERCDCCRQYASDGHAAEAASPSLNWLMAHLREGIVAERRNRTRNANVLAGLRCPACGAEGPFDIRGQATFLGVTDEGTDAYQDMDWSAEGTIVCSECQTSGTREDFEHHRTASFHRTRFEDSPSYRVIFFDENECSQLAGEHWGACPMNLVRAAECARRAVEGRSYLDQPVFDAELYLFVGRVRLSGEADADS